MQLSSFGCGKWVDGLWSGTAQTKGYTRQTWSAGAVATTHLLAVCPSVVAQFVDGRASCKVHKRPMRKRGRAMFITSPLLRLFIGDIADTRPWHPDPVPVVVIAPQERSYIGRPLQLGVPSLGHCLLVARHGASSSRFLFGWLGAVDGRVHLRYAFSAMAAAGMATAAARQRRQPPRGGGSAQHGAWRCCLLLLGDLPRTAGLQV